MAPLRHKRDTDARPRSPRIPRAALVAAPIATVATLAAVSAGVVASGPGTPDLVAQSPLSASIAQAAADDRRQTVSRSSDREEPSLETTALEAARKLDRFQDKRLSAAEARATARAVARADKRRWTTAPLNLWTLPGKQATKVGLIDEATKVLVTGRRGAGRVELAVDGRSRWVTAGYLADEKPKPPEPESSESSESSGSSGSSESSGNPEPALGGACTNGTSVSGQSNVIAVHRAVCAAFPSITGYGTYRGDGEHAQGIAIDIMVSGGTGWQVAEFVRANYAELGVNYIIYSQKIWSLDRSGEGWRWMEDRGSTTANHYDHVHVTTY